MPKVRKTARKERDPSAEERRRREIAREAAREEEIASQRRDAERQEARSPVDSPPEEEDADDGEAGPATGKPAQQSYNFTARQEEKLVNFFAENPCFWDKPSANFMNKNHKDRKLTEISEELVCDGRYKIKNY